MKLLKKNKSLCFLLIIATIYVLVTLLYINPLREKNTKLEEKRNEILTLRQEDDSIQVFSEKEKVAEDIILSIEKSIGNLVDINFINKQYEQGEQPEVVILELNFSSNSKNLFKIDKKLKELDLYDSIEMINQWSYIKENVV